MRKTHRNSKRNKSNYVLATVLSVMVTSTGMLSYGLINASIHNQAEAKIENNSNSFLRKKNTVNIVDNLSNVTFKVKIANDQFPSKIEGRNNKTLISTNNAYIGKPMPVEIEAAGMGENAAIAVNGQKLSRNNNLFTGEIVLDKIDKDTNIKIEIVDGDDDREYGIRTLPQDFPSVYFEPDNDVDNGVFYYTNFYPTTRADYQKEIPEERQFGSYVVKYDSKGSVLFYQKSAERELVGFNRWEDDVTDEKGYYYFSETSEDGFGHRSYRRGEYVILDDNYREINRVKPLKTELHNIDDLKTEMHDFVVLGKDHYILSDYVPRDHNGVTVIDTYLQEQLNGEVIWEWSSKDVPLFSDVYNNDPATFEVIPSSEGTAAIDGIHTNSIFIDTSDGNIILSNRNINAIVKIDKNTGDVIWIMGGEYNEFDLDKAEGFNHQHHARINDDGKFMFYDNNSDGEFSRGIIADIDQENKKLSNVQELKYNDQHGMYTGSVTQVDIADKKYTLVGWGMEKKYPVIASLFDKDGQVVKNITADEKDGVETYRVIARRD